MSTIMFLKARTAVEDTAVVDVRCYRRALRDAAVRMQFDARDGVVLVGKRVYTRFDEPSNIGVIYADGVQVARIESDLTWLGKKRVTLVVNVALDAKYKKALEDSVRNCKGKDTRLVVKEQDLMD